MLESSSALRDAKRAFQTYVTSASNGEAINASEIGSAFGILSERQKSVLFEEYLKDEQLERRLYAIYFAFALDCPEDTRSDAIRVFGKCCEEGDESFGMALSVMGGLVDPPQGLFPYVKRSLESKDFVLRLLGAVLGVKSEHYAVASLEILSKALDGADANIRWVIVNGLVGAQVRIDQVASLLVSVFEELTEPQQISMIARLHSRFSKSQQLIGLLSKITKDPRASKRLRACCGRMLGHVAPLSETVQKLLVESLNKETECELIKAFGLGLLNQDLDIPQQVIEREIEFLRSCDPELRDIASDFLEESFRYLESRHLECLAEAINQHPESLTKVRIARTFVKCRSAGIPIVLEQLLMREPVDQMLWLNILVDLNSKYAESVANKLVEKGVEHFESTFPLILTNATGIHQRLDEWIRDMITSSNRNRRESGLTALANNPDAIRFKAPLIELYLSGSADESDAVLGILSRVGLEDSDVVLEPELLSRVSSARLSYLKLRVQQNANCASIDRELQKIEDNRFIKRFVAVATILEERGATSFSAIHKEISEKAKLDENTKRILVSQRTLEMSFKRFEGLLTEITKEPVELLTAAVRNRPAGLSDMGHYWLRRCRDYLMQLEE